MKKLKQASAAVVAAMVTAASFAGCTSSTDYAITANGEKINAGVYINYILNEMSNEMYTLYYSGEITDMSECFDQEIDGVDFKTYVKDAAMEDTKELAAIRAKFDELGLTLSDEDQQEIEDSVSETWSDSSEFYEYEGISEESLTQCYEVSYMHDAIFDYYYAEGGIEEVSDDDIQEFINENYIRYKVIYASKSTEEDEDTAEAEDEETLELLNSYVEEAEGMSFEDFDTIIDEYDAYQEALEAEEEEESEEEDTDTEETEETDESAEDSEEDTSESESEDESSEDEAAEDTESDESAEDESSSDEDSDSSEESEDTESEEEADSEEDSDETADESDEDTDEDEEEDDPYVNESMFNYTDYTDEDSDYYDEEYADMINAFLEADYETAGIYEDDDYYYLYMTADVADRTDYVEDNKEDLLDEIKGDEFDELIEGWVSDMDITENSKAVKKYTVQEVYDRQVEYYEE